MNGVKKLSILAMLTLSLLLSGCDDTPQFINEGDTIIEYNGEPVYTQSQVDSLIETQQAKINDLEQKLEYMKENDIYNLEQRIEELEYNSIKDETIRHDFNATQYVEVNYELYRNIYTIKLLGGCIEICEDWEEDTSMSETEFNIWWIEFIESYQGFID